MGKRYVAKCSANLGKLFNYELSPRFDNSIDCLEYIQNSKDIILIEEYLSSAFYRINSFYFEDNKKKQKLFFSSGSMVRVYDLEQNRFCDSFDF